jgi:transposase
MQQKTVLRYSLAFKQQVVSDVEGGRFRTLQEAGVHYGILGKQTVRRWLSRWGKGHLIPKVVRVEKPDEADQIRQFKKQIRQLQEALGKTQLENVLNASFLQIACEQLGVAPAEFKKKAVTKRCIDPGTEAGGP